MEKEFNYYIIEPIITEQTPLLMNDGKVDPNGINFLYLNTIMANNYVAPLQFLMALKNPDMDTDYLFLETYAVFSEKVCNALKKYMPIKNLQLVKAIIRENNEEYTGFSIAGIHQIIQAFDEKQSKYKKITRKGEWVGIKKIVMDREKLAQIPLEERLVFKAKEDSGLKLYHESIVNIIKSVKPKGLQFIPVEKWSRAMTF